MNVLQRVARHPAAEVALLTPRLWKQHFAPQSPALRPLPHPQVGDKHAGRLPVTLFSGLLQMDGMGAYIVGVARAGARTAWLPITHDRQQFQSFHGVSPNFWWMSGRRLATVNLNTINQIHAAIFIGSFRAKQKKMAKTCSLNFPHTKKIGRPTFIRLWLYTDRGDRADLVHVPTASSLSLFAIVRRPSPQRIWAAGLAFPSQSGKKAMTAARSRPPSRLPKERNLVRHGETGTRSVRFASFRY